MGKEFGKEVVGRFKTGVTGLYRIDFDFSGWTGGTGGAGGRSWSPGRKPSILLALGEG